MNKITMTDLIATLRKAAASPASHSEAQKQYFSQLKEDSVLTICDHACCVAGYLFLYAHEGLPDYQLMDFIEYSGGNVPPDEWVAKALELSDIEATLAFDSGTHYKVHELLADLLEAGLRLPSTGTAMISYFSAYTKFERIYLDSFRNSMELEELLDWMRASAK
jgi:hypothetical protein